MHNMPYNPYQNEINNNLYKNYWNSQFGYTNNQDFGAHSYNQKNYENMLLQQYNNCNEKQGYYQMNNINCEAPHYPGVPLEEYPHMNLMNNGLSYPHQTLAHNYPVYEYPSRPYIPNESTLEQGYLAQSGLNNFNQANAYPYNNNIGINSNNVPYTKEHYEKASKYENYIANWKNGMSLKPKTKGKKKSKKEKNVSKTEKKNIIKTEVNVEN